MTTHSRSHKGIEMGSIELGSVSFELRRAKGRDLRGVLPALTALQARMSRYSTQLRGYMLDKDVGDPPRLEIDEDEYQAILGFIADHVVSAEGLEWDAAADHPDKVDLLDTLTLEHVVKLSGAIMTPADGLPEVLAGEPGDGSAT